MPGSGHRITPIVDEELPDSLLCYVHLEDDFHPENREDHLGGESNHDSMIDHYRKDSLQSDGKDG